MQTKEINRIRKDVNFLLEHVSYDNISEKKNASKLHTKLPIQSKAGTSNFTPGCFLDAENEKYV